LAESGPEAIIPLAGGNIPVSLTGNDQTTQATINTLVTVGMGVNELVELTSEQTAKYDATNIAINTMSERIIQALNLGFSNVTNSIKDLQSAAVLGSSIATIAAGASALGSLFSSLSSFSSSSGSSASSGGSAPYGAYQSGTFSGISSGFACRSGL